MRFRTKLAMASAAAALMAGTAYADTTLVIAPSGAGILGMAVADTDAVAEGGVTVNLAAGSNFLNQTGTLVLQASSSTGFGLAGSPGNVVINLTGTGFVLNGAPSIGSNIAAGTDPDGQCTDVNFGMIDAGGTAGDTIVAWNDVSNLALCADGGGSMPNGTSDGVTPGILTVELPVIMTNTAAGISASANIDIQLAATDSTVEADALDAPAVVTVDPFDAAVAAAATAPVLSLTSTPAFSAFTSAGGDVGTLAIDQTGGGVVTRIADAAGNPVANPATIDIDVTFGQDATGIDSVTLSTMNGTVTLAQSMANPNVFTGTVSGASDLAVGELFTDSDPAADPITGATVTVVLAGDAGVAAQPVSIAATARDGSGAAISTASVSGALAALEREGTTVSFEWVAFEPAFVNNIFRFTGLTAGTNVFASASGLNTGQSVTEQEISSSLTINNGEAQITGSQLGSLLGIDTSLPPSTVRGRVNFTIEALDDVVGVNRVWFNSNGGVDSANGNLKKGDTTF